MAIAEIISIGTELLLGQVLDTNSQYISGELADLGIDCLFRSTVGDNPGRIISTLKHALNRSDIAITTGGLGPTADDLTHECIAELFSASMQLDEEVLAYIESLFSSRGMKMSESNKKQAYRPAGAQLLANPCGSAPGIIWTLDKTLLEKAGIENPEKARFILTFPGVPSEMKAMWEATARKFLRNQFEESALFSQELKHYGIAESRLAEKYADLLELASPTVAPLAGMGECRLRVSAKAVSLEEARKIAEPVIERIKTESAHLCYGIDSDNLETVAGRLLKERNLSVSCAESCTGGLLSKRLTDVAGSSAYVKLNLVTYANEAKHALLQVPEQILEKHGAVSIECAEAMAEGVRRLSSCDIGIGITGIAGPEGGSLEKPVGLVFIGLRSKDLLLVAKRLYPEQMGRDGIRFRSASDALNILRLYLIDPELLRQEEYFRPLSISH